ncbi:MAG: NAD(P)/FAD-dependent oxidoreductase [Ignavibacteria bacterium]|jgi:predicted Rossmann fold flavoprotein
MAHYDVVVLGAGAAGLFCAAQAAAWGKRVALLEHNDRPGKKIRISGGGRCNFTNRIVTHQNFISENPDFARSALARYTPDDFIAMVDAHGISWHEKTLGQLFCDGSAQQIIDMLLAECEQANVDLHFGIAVKNASHNGQFTIATSSGDVTADALVVATGGLSIPSLGASDLGYRIAKHFGHSIVEPLPALVPLVFPQQQWSRFAAISGVSTEAIVRAGSAVFRENILVTHKGLSGPAILQISTYARHNTSFTIDLLPNVPAEDIVADFPSEKRYLSTILRGFLPQRFIDAWPDENLHVPVNSIMRAATEQTLQNLHEWKLNFQNTEGYAKAEVTSGGVDTRELSSKTMESKRQNGLYFVGEVVDVTGWLGGYNFQWAWSSAFAAGASLRQ